jgi:endonuclease G
LAVAEGAVNDTFHFTNCSPQHPNFNRGKLVWAGLEDYILKTRAEGENRRLCVFTGPVFRDNDPAIGFPDVGHTQGKAKLPLEYWKVVVMVKASGQLTAAGFLVSQADLVRPMATEAAIDVAKTYQVKVGKIEEHTGFDFGRLRNADPLLARGGLERLEPEAAPVPLDSYNAIEI